LSVVVSFDDGDHWQTLKRNLPAVSVRDLVVHGDDLVIATFGRGFWIMDDITPLRQIDAESASAEALLFKPATAVRLNPEGFFGTPFPPEEPQAKNPPDGALVDYFLKSDAEVTLEILDAKGAVVRKFSSSDPVSSPRGPQVIADIWIASPQRLAGKAGVNRFVWDLRYELPPVEEGTGGRTVPQGPQVLPGTYQVKLTVAGKSYTQPLKVMPDPRSNATPADLQKQFDLSMSIRRDMERAAEMARKGVAAASLRRINSMLITALGVAGSADRIPPATAYDLAQQASRDLNNLLAGK
jgi:hypothetical protein